jgi:hypothetical protein
VPKLILADSVRVVNLVAQHEEGSLAQVLHAEQRIELGLALGEALGVFGVDEEAAAADGELFGCRVEGGLEDCDAVVLEHVEELDAVLVGVLAAWRVERG